MNEEEVKELLKKIKANYQDFQIDKEYIIDEWCERLSHYSKEEVYQNLENHFNGPRNNEIPRLSSLTKNIITVELKESREKDPEGVFYCQWCGTDYNSLIEVKECQERCLRLKYIAKMMDLFLIDPIETFGKSIYRCSLKELNNNYDDFIKKVIKAESENHKLNSMELQGLKAYYENCLKNKHKIIKN